MLENVSENRLTDETIRRMFQLVGQAVTDPKFQELVYQITQAVPGKDYSGEVRSIFNWVKANIKYTRDPYGVELVQDVWSTINRGRADCDDFSILIAAMGEVMGNPSRFVTVSTRPDKEPCHVYPELNTRGRWTALDVTVAGSSPGWRPSAGITDRRIWTRGDVGVSGYESATVEGLGMVAPFFRSSVGPINLTPGTPNDISHTYTEMERGPAVQIHRPQPGTPRAMVARYSDTTSQPGPGGIPYDGHYPIRSQRSYQDAWSFIARKDVPIHLNAWGYMEPWKTDWSKALPQPNVSEKQLMMNSWSGYGSGLAGVDADPAEADAVVAAVAKDTQQKVAAGKIHPSRAAAHAASVIDAVARGDSATVSKNPATAKTLVAISNRRMGRPRITGTGASNEPSFSWLPKMDGSEGGLGEYYQRGVNLGGLDAGTVAAVTDAVQRDVTNAVAAGALAPSDAPAATARVVDAVQSGDASVVNTTATPATAAVVKRLKRGTGVARTPATKPSDPVSSGARRNDQMRASDNDYWLNDPSLEWSPQLYGLGGLDGGIRIGRGDRSSLFQVVHAHVKRMLPAEARRQGVHPTRIAAVLGKKSSGVSGLGQTQSVTIDPGTASAAAGNITNAIVGVVDPADSAAVAQAVQAGVTAIVGQAAPSSGLGFNLKGWGIPLLMVSAVGGLAYMMTRRKKLSYKRNPGRRRSGGRKGKSDMGKYLLWGGGALAAYMVLKPAAPAAPGAPQTLAQKLMSTAMNLFKPSASGAPGAGTSAISSISSAIFGSGSKVTAPTSSSPAAPAPAAAPTDPFAQNQAAIDAINTANGAGPQDNSMIVSLDEPSST
jgi:antitoxin (DNA-binding transcriptional repressor) of toxin-antitoxin stability system